MEYRQNGRYFYLAPGDLVVARASSLPQGSRFPTGHYHGIAVVIDPADAPECLSCILSDVEVRPAALMEKLGLRRGNGSMRALCEPAKQRFGGDYATALAEAIRLNDRAMFSSHALTQEQRESALKFYADTQGSLKKNVKWYHRMWIKWIQCLY